MSKIIRIAPRTIQALTAMVLLSLTTAPSALAQVTKDGTLRSGRIGAAIVAAAPQVLEDVFDAPVNTGWSVRAITKTTSAEIPFDPTVPITVVGHKGISLSVRLPFAEKTGMANILPDSTVVLDHKNGAKTVPVLKSDGSVQIITLIESAQAPTRYEYHVAAVNQDSVLVAQEGLVIVRAARDGKFLGGIVPPWARDAVGREIPTHYEIVGNTLTQVVDHTDIQGIKYPIVAYLWLGADFFESVTLGSYKSEIMVNANKSTWGQVVHTPGAGQVVFWTAGWDELQSKETRVQEKETLHQQYDCHVGGGFANFAGNRMELGEVTPRQNGALDIRCCDSSL